MSDCTLQRQANKPINSDVNDLYTAQSEINALKDMFYDTDSNVKKKICKQTQFEMKITKKQKQYKETNTNKKMCLVEK